MVDLSYNPFKQKRVVKTKYGIINREERRYYTHRHPEHFFKKFQGFAISVPEVEICNQERVTHIIINYHGKKKNVLYRIDVDYLKYMKTYDNDGDVQIILPIRELKVIGTEEIQSEE